MAKKILIIKILLQSKVKGKYKVEYCGYFRNCRREGVKCTPITIIEYLKVYIMECICLS